VSRRDDSIESLIGDGRDQAPMMRGTMLWFNEAKDTGFIHTDEGERLSAPGDGFAGGVRPQGRCARAVVSFELTDIEGVRRADNVVLVAEESPRRARRRTRSAR
jgi:hypothetical protein